MPPTEIAHAERAQHRQDVEGQVLLVVLMGRGSQLTHGRLQPASHILVQCDASVFSIRGRLFPLFDLLREQVFGFLTIRRGDAQTETRGVAEIHHPHVTIFAFPNGRHFARLVYFVQDAAVAMYLARVS